jgi:hypothetical protein
MTATTFKYAQEDLKEFARKLRKHPNTIVNVGDHMFNVWLHGHEIVFLDLDTNELRLWHRGWKTVTTHRRINQVLDTIESGLTLRSVRTQWRVVDHVTGDEILFTDGMTINMLKPF